MIFPVAYDKMSKVDKILESNANAKYIHDIEGHWLDKEVKKACDASVYE
jgi:hypothetical protein